MQQGGLLQLVGRSSSSSSSRERGHWNSEVDSVLYAVAAAAEAAQPPARYDPVHDEVGSKLTSAACRLWIAAAVSTKYGVAHHQDVVCSGVIQGLLMYAAQDRQRWMSWERTVSQLTARTDSSVVITCAGMLAESPRIGACHEGFNAVLSIRNTTLAWPPCCGTTTAPPQPAMCSVEHFTLFGVTVTKATIREYALASNLKS